MNHSDTALTDKEMNLVNALASRLRLVHADLSQAGSEERRLSLRDEVSRMLKDASRPDRQRLLQGLLERFPVAGQAIRLAAAPQPAAAAAPEPEPETPDQLFDRFLAVCRDLPADHRAQWVQRLASEGMVQVETHEVQPPINIPPEWIKSIGLSEGQSPQLDRVFLLLGELSTLLLRVDQATSKTLEQWNVPRNRISEEKELSGAFREYLTGKRETLKLEVQAFSSRLGSLVTGMLVGGRNYGNEFLRRCSPEAIEEVVKTEGRHGFRRSFELCCWDKYKDLARGFATADLIDRQIKDCMGKVVRGKLGL